MVNLQWLLGLTTVILNWESPQKNTTAAGGATTATAQRCTTMRTRKSWADMTATEKTAYITAVKCLYTSPAKGTAQFPGAQSRHDDFAATHIYYTTAPSDDGGPTGHGMEGPGIHFNGVFLPWHRYFLWAYESALINECQYTGAQPYWDWTLDNPEYGSSFEKSAVFDPTTGFGGNGVGSTLAVYADQQGPPPGNCIGDGPFSTLQVPFGYGFSVTSNPHCLIRNFNVTLANDSLGWTKNILPLLAKTDYWTMAQEWDYSSVGAPSGPHGAGHKGVGGEMENIWSAVNDPIFFLHHAQIDHIYWLWQSQHSKQISKTVGGPIYPNGTGDDVTLQYTLKMFDFIAPDAPISMVIDAANSDSTGLLCYTYEHEETGVAGYR